MDKIISSRVSEAVAHQIELLSKRLGMSKKKVIEEAVLAYARQAGKAREMDVFEQTCGAWNRDEAPEDTVEQVRKAFRESMERNSK